MASSSPEIIPDQASLADKTATLDTEKQQALAVEKGEADAALAFLNNEAGTVAEVDEKALVRKIDWRIVPLMCEHCNVRAEGVGEMDG